MNSSQDQTYRFIQGALYFALMISLIFLFYVVTAIFKEQAKSHQRKYPTTWVRFEAKLKNG